MKKIEEVCAFLGAPYKVTVIDLEEVIYRDLGNGFDFEVSGIRRGSNTFSLYVWRLKPQKEIVGIYHDIHGLENLKDTLGYYAFKYQNLLEKIRIEREESMQ